MVYIYKANKFEDNRCSYYSYSDYLYRILDFKIVE